VPGAADYFEKPRYVTLPVHTELVPLRQPDVDLFPQSLRTDPNVFGIEKRHEVLLKPEFEPVDNILPESCHLSGSNYQHRGIIGDAGSDESRPWTAHRPEIAARP